MRTDCKQHASPQDRCRGFSTLELLMFMVVSLIIAALAIPKFYQVRRTLRISGDARNLNGAINQAKLQAASNFTWARVYVDIGANTPNTFHVDLWNKANNCWQVVGDLANPCYVPGTSPVQNLSRDVTFGFAGVGAPPPNTQANGIQQALRCFGPQGKAFGYVANTACVAFSSRGTPIDPNNGAPYGNDAVYITDNSQVYAVTVGITGISRVWSTSANGQANWYQK